MEGKEIKNKETDITPITDSFASNLKAKLTEKGFSENQIETIHLDIIEIGKEVGDKSNTKNQSNDPLMKIMNYVADRPQLIFDRIPTDKKQFLWKPVLDFGVVVILVAALSVLALCGHFEATHTATLFGGIVGYVLGNTRR